MQIGPAIADRVGSLTIFQRSPQWIAPNDDYFTTIDDGVHWLMDNIPGYREWYRARLSWIFNDKVYSSLQVDPDWPEPSARSMRPTMVIASSTNAISAISWVIEQI